MRGHYHNEILLRRPRVGADPQPDPRFAALRRAVHAVFDFRDHAPAPWYVYAETAYGPEVSPHPSQEAAYDRARLREGVPGENYVAVFEVADPLWPDPVYARYRPLPGAAAGASTEPVTSPSQIDVRVPSDSGPVMPPEYAAPPPHVSPSRSARSPREIARQYRAAQYQSDLNHETDLLFWSETRYKPNNPLDPNDPIDARWIPVWLKTRDRVARDFPPHVLRRSTASAAVLEAFARDPIPAAYYVYSSSASMGENVAPFDDKDRTWQYVHQRLTDSDYVAYFETASPKWPSPVFEDFPKLRSA